jgi:hypothetical protein
MQKLFQLCSEPVMLDISVVLVEHNLALSIYDLDKAHPKPKKELGTN